MQNLFAFFYRYAFVFLFLIFEFISIRFIVSRNANQREIFLNSSSIISGGLFERASRIKKYFGLNEVNLKLAEENAALKAKIDNLTAYTPDASDSISDTVYNQRFVLQAAQVINNSVELRNNMLTIDKGSDDGVLKYATVIEPQGIVGFVTHTGKRYSSVMSILNSNSRVSAMIKRTLTRGNLVWTGTSPTVLNVEAIPKHADVRVGDTLVTSSFSHFPIGHPIGEVINAIVEPGENFYIIEVRLFNDLSRTNYVYVVNDLHKNEIDSLTNLNKLK
jgi:rod shape-determining protein MreC